ncbi:MAG TPA: DUF1918 domain-containing protein [Acidimicrobiales bacterium]|nr:DUF1918 domain-containing protein [Acidimicrobiales bacterium]
MRAAIGDMLVVHGHRAGEADRTGEIIEVHEAGGAPPYVVRWDEDGHVGLVFPGPDATIQRVAGRAGHGSPRPRGHRKGPRPSPVRH